MAFFVKRVSWSMKYETEASYNSLPHKTVSRQKVYALMRADEIIGIGKLF